MDGEEKMFCSKCGKEVSGDSIFCYSCGSKVFVSKIQNPIDNTTSIVIDNEDQSNQKSLDIKMTFMSFIKWWKFSEDEIRYQIDNYDSLKFTKSYRGMSVICLGYVVVSTLLMSVLNNNLSDIYVMIQFIIPVFLSIFIYKGYKWSIITTMIWWSIEKMYQLYTIMDSSPSNSIVAPLFYWYFFIGIFYRTFTVEKHKTGII
jgi:hypothetical protein